MRRTVLCMLALILAACGVPTDETATPVELDEAADLLATSTTTTSLPEPETREAIIYLLQGDLLDDQARRISPPVAERDVIEALLAGTTEAEAAQDIRTAIPQGTELLEASHLGDVLVVDFNEEFREAEDAAQSQALAQVVWTVDDLVAGSKIEFRIAGVPQSARIDGGEVALRCVTKGDFLTFAPDYDPAAPPPTTIPPPDDCEIEALDS